MTGIDCAHLVLSLEERALSFPLLRNFSLEVSIPEFFEIEMPDVDLCRRGDDIGLVDSFEGNTIHLEGPCARTQSKRKFANISDSIKTLYNPTKSAELSH